MASVGVCTRPIELLDEPETMARARLAFMPTSQSAFARLSAAVYRLIDNGILVVYSLQQTLCVHLVRLLFDVPEIVCLRLLVAQTLLVAVLKKQLEAQLSTLNLGNQGVTEEGDAAEKGLSGEDEGKIRKEVEEK
jgi:hypothetical protein